MVPSAALLVLALNGHLGGATLSRDATFEASPWSLDLRLRSPLLDASSATPMLAQSSPRAPETATARASGASAGGAADSLPDGQAAQCDVDCDTCHDAEREARYLLRRRERNLRVHRGFALAAWGGLAVTEVLGTILAINHQTWFGDGSCASSSGGIGGDFGCGTGLVSLHETFAFITTGLYTTAGVIAATAPDPDGASTGADPASGRLRLHKTLAWVHGAGMILLPILGVLASNPQMLGLDPSTDPGTVRGFQSAMRSIHTIVGYTTFVAFSISAGVELF
ncbi:MAG: hypothetical protein U0326_23000 [Polyangiales bacterium]